MSAIPKPRDSDTIVQLLRRNADGWPDLNAYTYLLDGERQEQRLTWAELERQAQAIASVLTSSTAAGDRVLLVYPPGLDFIAALLGCMWARTAAVPAYPPDPARLDRTLPRLEAIALDAEPTVALTLSWFLPVLEPHLSRLGSIQWLPTDDGGLATNSEASAHGPNPEDIALVQYTSGTTGEPKGVVIKHHHLMHNHHMIHDACGSSEHSVQVSWLPFYHDMGLIGGTMQTIYERATAVLMSPLDFIVKPARWLRAITDYRGTVSSGPNFAYDLAVRRVEVGEIESLDLSSWVTALNGSERIRSETLDRFVDKFGPCGFRREAFLPCYGLAEATLMVSGFKRSPEPVVGRGAEGRLHLGCGAWDDTQVLIVDTEGLIACKDGDVGEIWVAGPSVAAGYWNRPDLSEATFGARLAGGDGGPFLRTGDLGYTEQGELFVTGRLKDLIIIRGRNHDPVDIERTVQASHPSLRPGCGAAFALDVGGEERLAIVQEVRDEQLDPDSVAKEIVAAVSKEHQIACYTVALIAPRSLTKTSSGKIQRHASRTALLGGSLELVTEWRPDRDRRDGST